MYWAPGLNKSAEIDTLLVKVRSLKSPCIRGVQKMNIRKIPYF